MRHPRHRLRSYFGQIIMEMFDNTEWRRKLKAEGDAKCQAAIDEHEAKEAKKAAEKKSTTAEGSTRKAKKVD